MIQPQKCAQLMTIAYEQYKLGKAMGPSDATTITGQDALFYGQALGLGPVVSYGYFGQSREDPSQYLVLIRGTQTWREWAENALFLQAFCPFSDGMVESGFLTIYSTLTMDGLPLCDALAKRLKPGDTVTITGHSLGAALATLIAHQARQKLPDGVTVKGVFLASPHVGNASYADTCDRTLGLDYAVYNYLRDVVPRLPISLPLVLNYVHLPNTVVLRPTDSDVPLPDNVDANHDAGTYVHLLSRYSQ